MSLPPLWTSQHDLFLCAHERVNIPLRQIIRQIRVHFPSLSVYPIKVSALERRIEMLEFEDNDYWVRDVRGYRWAVGLEGAEGDGASSRGTGWAGKGGGLAQDDMKENKRRKDARSYYGLTDGGGGGGDFGFARPVEISTQGLEVVEDGAKYVSQLFSVLLISSSVYLLFRCGSSQHDE